MNTSLSFTYAMAAPKKQCWEVMNCGSEKDMSCPTVVQRSGRACWLVAGTLNGSQPVCKKICNTSNCKDCLFYQDVKQYPKSGWADELLRGCDNV